VVFAWRDVDHAGVEQRRLGAVQPRRHWPDSHWMVWVQLAGRGDQLLATGVELCLGQPLWRDAGERGDLRDCPPLQLGRLGVESQLGCDLMKPSVELSVDAGGDLPDAKLARDEVLGRWTHAAGDDQPRHQPPVMTPDS
jgi:hypothetical protein